MFDQHYRAIHRNRRLSIGNFSLLFGLLIITSFAPTLKSQVSVQASPSALLVENGQGAGLSATVSGTLQGELTSVTWTANDLAIASSFNQAAIPGGSSLAGNPGIMKATSDHDKTKFAAVPVVNLRRSDLAQLRLPDAVAYHPATGFVYAVILAPRGGTSGDIDSTILQVAPDGTTANVLTLPSIVVSKLVPFSNGGNSYLLAVDFVNSQILAVDLGAKTSKPVVRGLSGPFSAAIHPTTGDLYIAEQNARRVSLVSRSALESAISGTSTAPFQALPITIPNISGLAFFVDQSTQTVSLLASASADGTIYRINLATNASTVIANGISQAQQILTLQSPQLGFSFVLMGASTRVDGQGQIRAMSAAGNIAGAGATYILGVGLDTVTDLSFVPPGTPYSSNGKWLILAASSSTTPNRGKIVRWEPDASLPVEFFSIFDQAKPALAIISPAPGTTVSAGAPIEVQWSHGSGTPLNSAASHFPFPAQVEVSTDNGGTFSPTGVVSTPSTLGGGLYSLKWHVPANLAGQIVRLRIQTVGLDGKALRSANSGELLIQDKTSALPQAARIAPNFIVAGQSANVSVTGMNFQPQTLFNAPDGISVVSTKAATASQLDVQLQAGASAAVGPRDITICNPAGCQSIASAFFVLPASGPRIASLSSESGAPGASVVVTGVNFSPSLGNNSVAFGGMAGSVSRATTTQLTVQVPYGLNLGDVPIRVQVNGVASNAARFSVILPGFAFPSISDGGIVNGASFALAPAPVAPGSIASIYGSNLISTIVPDVTFPLPTTLFGTTIVIGGIPAPFFFAAPNQINAQIPEELAGLTSVPVTIYSGAAPGNTVMLNIANQSPGIFSTAASGRGPGAIVNQNGTLNGLLNAERVGRVLSIYATGLGPADPPVATGAPGPSDTVSRSAIPTVTIDGIAAPLQFAGRAPGFVGLDQINVTIPSGVSTSRPIPVVVSSGGAVSNSVTVVVVP